MANKGGNRAVGLSSGQMYQGYMGYIEWHWVHSLGYAIPFSLSAPHDTGHHSVSCVDPNHQRSFPSAILANGIKPIGFNLEPTWGGLAKSSPPVWEENWEAKTCVAWPCQTQCSAHPFSLHHRSHGTANTTENISQLIISVELCYLVAFLFIFYVFIYFLEFIFYLFSLIPNVQPSFSQCPGRASWTYWAGVPPYTSHDKRYKLKSKVYILVNVQHKQLVTFLFSSLNNHKS